MSRPSPTAPINLFDDVGLYFCRIVIPFDVSDNFDGYDVVRIVVVAVSVTIGVMVALVLIVVLVLVFRMVSHIVVSAVIIIVVPTLPFPSPFDVQTFNDPSKSSHAHFFEDAIPIGNDMAIFPLEVTDGVVLNICRGRR